MKNRCRTVPIYIRATEVDGVGVSVSLTVGAGLVADVVVAVVK